MATLQLILPDILLLNIRFSLYLSMERLPHEDLLPGGLVVDVVDADDVGHVLLKVNR